MGRKRIKRANHSRFPKKSKRVQKQKHPPHLLFEVAPISATAKVKTTSYIYIKIPGARKAIPKHRYLWEQAHGTIPKGYNIIFKNGNTLDCCLENLACVSNEELMQNNTIHRYPNELKTAIKQISKIKKQLTK